MKTWSERPQDVAHLLNPAYLGVLLERAIFAYVKDAGYAMPYALSFLVLPFVLHARTRDRLPATVKTTLPTWIHTERDVVIHFSSRAQGLSPYTKESLLFLATHRYVTIERDGSIGKGEKTPRGFSRIERSSDDIAKSLKSATFVGRWLLRSGSPTTLFTLLGVAP